MFYHTHKKVSKNALRESKDYLHFIQISQSDYSTQKNKG